MWRRKRMLRELESDIREHIERETQDNIERGMSPKEARYAAMRKFGNTLRVQEDVREVWSLVWLEQLLQDVRYGVRVLAKSPAFTAIVVMTLALGIGAATAVFSIVYAVLINPYPFRDWQRLVTLNFRDQSGDIRCCLGPTGAQVQQLRRTNSIEEIVAFNHQSLTTTGGDLPEEPGCLLLDAKCHQLFRRASGAGPRTCFLRRA